MNKLNIQALRHSHARRRKYYRALSVLAAVAVFVTTYALILPTITLESQATCGLEEHLHTAACYEEQLTCGLEESDAHQHTTDCYTSVLTCGKEEHQHTEACYETAPAEEDYNGEGAARAPLSDEWKTHTASGDNYTVTVSYGAAAGFPDDTALDVREITAAAADADSAAEYAEYANRTSAALGLESTAYAYARFFDIILLDEAGEPLQPADDAEVQVQIQLDDKDDEIAPQVVHFPEGEEPEILPAETDGQTVQFEATGFSVYGIVDAPEPASAEAKLVLELSELKEGVPFYLSYNGLRNYATNTLNGSGAFVEVSSATEASPWYFEPVSGDGADEYYIYTIVNGERMYMKNTSGNLMGLTTDTGTPFTLSQADEGKFFFKTTSENKWLQHSIGGAGMRLFNANTDATNARLSISYVSSYTLDKDPYDLDGKGFGLAYNNETASAAALTAEGKTVSSTQRLAGQAMLIRPDVLDNSGVLLVAENSDIVEWTFESVREDKYYLTTTVDGQKKYLTIRQANVTLEDEPDPDASLVTVTPGTGNNQGRWHFSINGYSLNYSGSAANGFNGATGNGETTWMNLVKKSENLSDDSFHYYSARKVNLSDTEKVPDGQQIILYTRIWNDSSKRYEFYAVDHNGSLVRCYDTGDNIEWIGSQVNTALWAFTEYHAADGTPNYYYELQNVSYHEYIAPQITGDQTLSASPLGINLNGRRYGESYSTIIAWDAENYAYVGLKTENGHIVACPLSEAEDFYFAIVDEATPDSSPLTTVDTIDSSQYGISMKMIDFNNGKTTQNSSNWRDPKQLAFFGGDLNMAGLLSTNLVDGYPTATAKTVSDGHSLSELFEENQLSAVNHLFLESIYRESGYFEYDSTQNFAHLNEDGTFTVYDQLLAVGTDSGATRTHGQFLPYNEIDPAVKAPYTNQTDVTGNPLPDTDPRKGEELYWVSFNDADYFFGMEMEASFTQTASGLDTWGHDIIFEFSGDDDFWLYVDGELILDLGGVDRAKTGTINFRTGVVTRSRGGNTTLYDLFKQNYKARGLSDADINAKLSSIFVKNANGQYVFRDYTNHTMKMFYMERGAGASNLHMRFNLAAVKPGTFILSKTLSGTDNPTNSLLEFPYQIYYTLKDDGGETLHRLTEKTASTGTEGGSSQGAQYAYNVKYADSDNPVRYASRFTPAGGQESYEDVFFLKPGESAEVTLPDNVATYYVVECGINPDIYDRVTVNGTAISGETTANTVNGTARENYKTAPASLADQQTVAYDNHVKDGAMRTLSITKKLYDQNGKDLLTYEKDKSVFTFRLYLGDENAAASQLPLADMYSYCVKDPEGNYCAWDAAAQAFTSLDKKVYSSLTAEEKEAAVFTTSMNGSISKIPANYTVEVRDLVIGTQFQVEERGYEIPKGYTLRLDDGYTRVDQNPETKQYQPLSGVIEKNNDPKIQVRNQKGWGLTVQKVWSDKDFMASHDAIYFAVYLKSTDESGAVQYTLLEDSVRRMRSPDTELYYFFGNLQDGIPFENYEIREVIVTPAEGQTTLQIDEATGSVKISEIDGSTLATVSPIEPPVKGDPAADGSLESQGKLVIGGTPVGGKYHADYTYDVTYKPGAQTTQNENVRTDTVINSRPGIQLIKTDWEENPLSQAVFTLTDDAGKDVAAPTYLSDADGLITTAYLNAGTYTLTELAAPTGYVAMRDPLQFTVRDDHSVTVNGADSDVYTIDTDNRDMTAILRVKNRASSFLAKKTDAATRHGIENVRFALYLQVKDVSGQPQKAYTPLAGYESLLTDENGVIPKIDYTLPPGTYYLSEIQAADGYDPIDGDLCFTIGIDGTVTVEDADRQSWLTSTTDADSGQVAYTIAVPNGKMKQVSFRKVDSSQTGNPPLSGAEFDLYSVIDGKRSADPLFAGLTAGDNGYLVFNGSTSTLSLGTGTYHLVETKPPSGYNQLLNPVVITVTAAGVTYDDGTALATSGEGVSVENRVYTLAISNNPGYELPSTGGPGTSAGFLSGGLLTGLAGMGLAIRKRRKRVL